MFLPVYLKILGDQISSIISVSDDLDCSSSYYKIGCVIYYDIGN